MNKLCNVRGCVPNMPAEASPATQVLASLPLESRQQRLPLLSSVVVIAIWALVPVCVLWIAVWFRVTDAGTAWMLAAVGVPSTLAFAFLSHRFWSVREVSARAETKHSQFLAAAENTLDDFYIFDGVPDAAGDIVDFRFSYINPNAERRLGVPRESLYGRILTEVRPFMIRSGLIEQYREVVRTGRPYTCEVFIDDDMIQSTWLNVQVVKLGQGIAITSRDVTEHRRRSDQIHYLAHHDHLTGLANRTLLHERLRQAIARADQQQQSVAVFVLDIDNFKQINDSLGHADGDILLANVGQRLLSSVRESDTVARLGGDEFVIVMLDFRSLDDVERCGKQIIRTAAQPIDIRGRAISITVSVGVAIYAESGIDATELLRQADAAMYTVKDTGRNSLCIFNAGMRESRVLGERFAVGHVSDRFRTEREPVA